MFTSNKGQWNIDFSWCTRISIKGVSFYLPFQDLIGTFVHLFVLRTHFHFNCSFDDKWKWQHR